MGWTPAVGQPVMLTVPPVTTAAAKNGSALDTSASISQRRAATAPGATRHRLGTVSSTSTPACRSIVTVMAICGADGRAAPVCCTVSPSVSAAPDSSSPETNCDDADASMATVPPLTAPVPRTVNGRLVPSMSTPRTPSASSSGVIGRVLACSSPSNSTTAFPSAASGGTNRSTVPASPQSTRAPVPGRSRRRRSARPRPRPAANPGCAARRPSGRCRGCAAPRRWWSRPDPARPPAPRVPAPGWSAISSRAR
ncbi:hypothetical protein C1Y40_04169 [Mycobacterium talmoniae]|uniref:Uncharacterized protein n=1 Tax=Mycobacterium talmoniae TaxID=1858794 RepID=A0A2S8BG72_9MYCO|nr:hypothetical protein C1Y40_04169 [Mycobacterium talmoniae]